MRTWSRSQNQIVITAQRVNRKVEKSSLDPVHSHVSQLLEALPAPQRVRAVDRRQRLHRLHRQRAVLPRQRLRPLDPVAPPNQVIRELHVPDVLEPPLDQRRQRRVLLRREQHRRRRDPLLQIPQRGLTQHAAAAHKVQNVVLELKRQPEVPAVVVRMARRLRVVPAEEHDGLGAVGDEGRRLEVRLLKVMIERHEPLGLGGHLHHLAGHQVLQYPRQQLNHLRVAQRRERDGRAREQEIASEDRQLVPNLQVQRPQAAARRSAVQHVVVQ